eukprot:5143246-Amphidinium_carterae.1
MKNPLVVRRREWKHQAFGLKNKNNGNLWCGVGWHSVVQGGRRVAPHYLTTFKFKVIGCHGTRSFMGFG